VAEFTGAMPALAGTERMAMRFDLLERRAGRAEFRRVTAPGLGRVGALGARPGRLRVHQARRGARRPVGVPGHRAVPLVRRPRAGAAHDDPAHAGLRPARPAAQLRIVALAPAADGHRATVVNLGGGPAGPFGVAVTVDGIERPAVTVPGLAAGEQAEVALPAPRCTPGSEIRAVVDPAGRVVERDERDNVLATICAR
jgi:hypothetical protein